MQINTERGRGCFLICKQPLWKKNVCILKTTFKVKSKSKFAFLCTFMRFSHAEINLPTISIKAFWCLYVFCIYPYYQLVEWCSFIMFWAVWFLQGCVLHAAWGGRVCHGMLIPTDLNQHHLYVTRQHVSSVNCHKQWPSYHIYLICISKSAIYID